MEQKTEDVISKLWENLKDEDKIKFEKANSCCGNGKVIDFTSLRPCAGVNLAEIKKRNWSVGQLVEIYYDI